MNCSAGRFERIIWDTCLQYLFNLLYATRIQLARVPELIFFFYKQQFVQEVKICKGCEMK